MRHTRVVAASLATLLALGVLALPAPSGAGAPEVLSVDPDSGPPGTEVSVSGFSSNVCVVTPPSEPLPRILGVVVTFSPEFGSTVDISDPLPMDDAGGTIPADAVPGPATLTAYCLEQNVDSTISRYSIDEMDFTGLAGPPPTTIPVPTTSTTVEPASEAPSAQPRYTG